MASGKSDTAHGLKALREENARRVLRILLDRPGGVRQVEIAEATDLARSTVSMLLSEVLSSVVTSAERGGKERGPRPRFWSIDRSAAYVVGLDIGRSHLTAALADPYREIVSGPYSVEMNTRPNPNQVLDAARSILERAIRSPERCQRIAAVMVGLPGMTDAENGFLIDPLASDWTEYDVPRSVEERWPFVPPPPVFVENDANLGAVGEFHKGAGQNVKSLLFIKWSTGIGSGLVLNGKLWRGKTGGAGELGHLTVNPTQADRKALRLPAKGDMPVCRRCGQSHCIEQIAGGQALADTLGVQDFGQVLRLAKGSDPDRQEEARAALNAAARLIGTAIGPVLTMLNVERVIVGGVGGNDGYPLVVQSIREGVDQSAPVKARTDAEIKPSELGDRAYVVGAVIGAFERTGVDFLYRRAAIDFREREESLEGTILAR